MIKHEDVEEKQYGTFSNNASDSRSKNISENKVTFDEILEEIGEFGKWQQWQSFLYSIPPFIAGSLFMLGAFTSQNSMLIGANRKINFIIVLEPGDFKCIPKACRYSILPSNITFQCSHNQSISSVVHDDFDNRTTAIFDQSGFWFLSYLFKLQS